MNSTPIETESYNTIYEQYAAAIQWMSGLGINLTSGRTAHYERILRHWKDAYRTASTEEAGNAFPDFVSSMFEIHDFVSIHKAFHDVPKNKLASIIGKLEKGVNGPINAADETPESTAARNHLFEARVAARAHRPTLGVEAILDATSDTGILINGTKIWVECKRVTTIDKIERNARKASSQLEVVLAREFDSGHHGLVALDVSKILNRGDKIYVARNDDELLASVDRQMNQFIEQHSNIWQRTYQSRHKKIFGTIVCFSFMATSEARNLLVHASQWAVNPRHGITESDGLIQQELAALLANAH